MEEGWSKRWAAGARLPDSRYRDDLAASWQGLADHPGSSWSAALGDRRRQSMGSLYHRQQYTVDDELAGVYRCAAEDWPPGEPGLMIVDTMFGDYRNHQATVGLGKIGTGGEGWGLCCQAALGASLDGQPRQVLDLICWTRGAGSQLPWPPEEKESTKWLKAMAAVQARLPGRPLTFVMDAESDAFEVLAAPRAPGNEVLLLVAQDRRVELDADEPPGWPAARLLKAAVVGVPVAGQVTLHLPARAAKDGRPAQKEREAVLQIRYRTVWIQPPDDWPKGTRPVKVSVVLAREEGELGEGAERVEWWLMSTALILSFEDAVLDTRRYSYRWRIEQVHRLLKETLRIERLQLDSAAKLSLAIGMQWPLAARALWLRYEAADHGDRPAAEVFEADEVVILSASAAHPVETVDDAVRAVGKLGGWVGGRKKDLPGAKVIVQGLFVLNERRIGYHLPREPCQLAMQTEVHTQVEVRGERAG